MVRALREEPTTSKGTVERVAHELGFGVESIRGWVKQAGIGRGEKPGVTSVEQARIEDLEQEPRVVKRANAILRSTSAFFAAELDRPQR